MPETKYETSIPLPEGSVVASAVLVVSYIDPDGKNQFAVGTRGEASKTQTLGLLYAAQQTVWDMD